VLGVENQQSILGKKRREEKVKPNAKKKKKKKKRKEKKKKKKEKKTKMKKRILQNRPISGHGSTTHIWRGVLRPGRRRKDWSGGGRIVKDRRKIGVVTRDGPTSEKTTNRNREPTPIGGRKTRQMESQSEGKFVESRQTNWEEPCHSAYIQVKRKNKTQCRKRRGTLGGKTKVKNFIGGE